MPTQAMIFSPCALLHSTTSCWFAGAQYRSFCECGGDLNTNHFSSVHITLSNQDSGNVNQNSHADFLASLLPGERTWTLCGLKAFYFKLFLRTSHTEVQSVGSFSNMTSTIFCKRFSLSPRKGSFPVACRG